ncbi:uncharacterized protein V6R79_012895 [Siganus canaliculatus]
MNEVICPKSHEEYEDDFEKDLDWLIHEESRSVDQGPDYEDIEADIDKELEEDEPLCGMERKKKSRKGEKRSNKSNKSKDLEEDEERWPSPMEPIEYDSDRDSPCKSPHIVPPPPGMEDQTDEEKKYILDKIQQANRELRDQEAPDLTRRRRLHFKDKLVDLVVPPLQFEKDGVSGEVGAGRGTKDTRVEVEVSGKLSELRLSPREERAASGGCDGAGEGSDGLREGRVLVEKDGKFDLVSLNEVKSQGLLPPIATSYSDFSRSTPRHQEQTASSSKNLRSPSSSSSSSSPRLRASSSSFQQDHFRAPRPPAQPRSRPSSASYRRNQGTGSKRRVQSATGTNCQATYTLSPQQKELLQRIQERKQRLAREEEQRKQEEEELKRQENELAFKAWVMRKKEQLQEEKRILRAQEMERMSSKKDSSDPEESFRLWLQRKHEQQQKEKQLVELKRLEEDQSYLLRSREECERAFKLWLRRKRVEKRVEQQVARERSRRLVLEERQARRTRDLMCAVNESKPFRFTEQLVYHF